eukprot:11865717-Karenia_brevis.AAC.1
MLGHQLQDSALLISFSPVRRLPLHATWVSSNPLFLIHSQGVLLSYIWDTVGHLPVQMDRRKNSASASRIQDWGTSPSILS